MSAMRQLLSNYRSSVNPPYNRRDLPAILATVAVLLSIPLVLLSLSRETVNRGLAATEEILEPETGVVTGNVQIVDDTTVSGGKFVRYGVTNPTPTATQTLQTFYVATTGSDTNPGTQSQPWKTFKKAATTLTAGQQALFADGTYTETQQAVIANSGTAAQPIVFKSQNKWGAKLVYQTEGVLVGGQPFKNHPKINNPDKDYITIQDFDITQTEYGDMTAGANLIRCWYGADYCSIIGNKLHGTTEVIKCSNNIGLLVDGNEIYDTTWGVGITRGVDTIFRNNNVYRFTENAFQTKMNTKNAKIYNNYVHSGTNYTSTDVAITLGGNSCGGTGGNCGNSDPAGYEGWGNVAYNNIIVEDAGGSIAIGIGMLGCYKCGAFNNTIVGATTALLAKNGGSGGGWTPIPSTVDPVFTNNIIKSCTTALNATAASGTVSVAYNLFNGCAVPSGATNYVTGDPLLTATWTLGAGSPAIDAGTVATFTNNAGIALNNELRIDKAGKTRNAPWDLGAYESN